MVDTGDRPSQYDGDKLMAQTNKKVDTFMGLNNLLNPASAEYREGMAWRAKDCRIDRSGLWTARPKLDASSSEPGHLTAWGSGTHLKNLAVQGTDKIIDGLATTESVDVGPNEILYGTIGSGTVTRQLADATKSSLAAPTNPTVDSAPADTGSGASRAENGVYWYIFTSYDSTYKHESIPAKAYMVTLADATTNHVTMTLTDNANGDDVYIYRTLRTSATDGVYNPNNKFYYVGKVSGDSQAFTDYMHDQEIINNEWEARGSVPPSAIDYIKSFNNRTYYFKGNVVYWSSAGRPQEVAQEFDLAIELTEGGSTQNVKCKPKLSIGVYGDAKYEISKLAGKTVTGAIERDGKLWIFTDNTTGYLIPTNQLEGVRYKQFRQGIGLVNDKCLVHTPYGVFGADRQGMWLLTNYGDLKRITDGRIDLLAGEDTTITQSYVTDSFMMWIPILNEVWWCMQYAADPTYIQIVFQADRGIFTGPYTHTITGGCNFVSTSGSYAYITEDKIVNTTTADAVAHYLDLWLGQSDPVNTKDELAVQIVHSAAPGAAVTMKTYQNDVASVSGITSEDTSHTTAIANTKAHGQGKMFKIELTLPTALAPIAAINYRYKLAGWTWAEKFRRML